MGRENQKASPSLESDWEALIALPRTLSVEELGLSTSPRAGFLAFGSSPNPQPSPSALARNSGWLFA